MIANDVVKRAMSILGVKAAGEELNGEDGEDGLEMLNTLLAEWRGADIPVTDYSVASLQATLTIPLAHKEAIAGKIAERLAGDYGVQLSPIQMKNIEEAFHRMQLAYFVSMPADYSGMPGTLYCHYE